MRYDVRLTKKDLLQEVGWEISEEHAKTLREMSRASNVAEMEVIGKAAARVQIPEDLEKLALYLPERFDTVIR